VGHVHHAVARELAGVAANLQALNLWDSQAPSAAALASQEPFCLDTLSFTQWLQFIFLPRMNTLCEQTLPLPTKCGVAPMSEEYFRPLNLDGAQLNAALARIDQILESCH